MPIPEYNNEKGLSCANNEARETKILAGIPPLSLLFHSIDTDESQL